MLFNSINYFIFLIISLVVYYLTPKKYRWIILLISSAAFYLIGDLQSFYVPVFIIIVTFFLGRLLYQEKNLKTKRIYLITGVVINVGLLFFFKYINFFFHSIVSPVFHISSTTFDNTFGSIVIPMGISFITFQAISYLIDINDNKYESKVNILKFSTYLLFFPKVISGPIERANDFLPQIKEHKADYDLIVDGLKRIVWGLFKKLVIANRLAIYTDAVFNNSSHHSGITLGFAAILYTFQLYADFSGYTDMAIGSAQLFGYRLSENFKRPLFALSITEFWRKWHITLTKWVTDYIFTPIVINKRDWGKWGVVYSSIITFVILGLWHGANWTYIFFGLTHGFILSIEFLTKKSRKKFRKKLPAGLNTFMGIVYTILAFSFSMVFFRSNTITESFDSLIKIFTASKPGFFIGDSPATLIYGFGGLGLLLLYELNLEFNFTNIKVFNSNNWFVQQIGFIVLIIIILLIGVFDGGQFIYFQF